MEGPKLYSVVCNVLNSMAVEYEDNVGVMLHEFLDRYIHEVLAHAKAHAERRAETSLDRHEDDKTINEGDINIAISALTEFAFQEGPTREALKAECKVRNRQPLQPIPDKHSLLLPPEEYCLLGQNWHVSHEGGMDLDL